MALLKTPSLEKIKTDYDRYREYNAECDEQLISDSPSNKWLSIRPISFEEMFGYSILIYPENKITVKKTIIL